MLAVSSEINVYKLALGHYKCLNCNDENSISTDATDDSCDPTPSQRMISLPQGCTDKETNSSSIDVGKCLEKKCIARDLKRMNDCKENFCCQRIAERNVRVNCLRHSFDMKKVTKCGCGDCLVRQTVVKGVARGGPENTPFKYGYIYHGEKYLTRTGRKGDFSFTVPGDFSRFVVTFKDKRGYNNFQELTKVIPLVPGRETFIEVRMKLRPEPIIVDAKEGFEIPLGNSENTQRSSKSGNDVENSDTQSGPAVAFAVPPQGLMTDDGEIYNGTVKVEVSFVDPRNQTQVEEADGDFTTVNEDGEQIQLETFGVVKMDFKDEKNNHLQPSGDISIFLDIEKYNITEKDVDNIKLWYMDEKTGRWRIMDTAFKKHQTQRSKRSYRMLYAASINAKKYNRLDFNLDKEADRCLFKVKVSNANEGDENFAVDITVYATQSGFKRYQSYAIPTNKAHCIYTICTQDSAIMRGATQSGDYLVPKDGLNDDVKERHGIVFPNSTSEMDRFSRQIKIQRLTKPLGNQPSPFYWDENSCETSPDEQSFSFEVPVRKKVKELKQFNDNWYPGNSLEAEVCYVKIAVENIHECPDKTASFFVESVSGNNHKREGYVTISMTETKSTECAEYKCLQKDSDEVITILVKSLSPGLFTKDKEATKKILKDLGGIIYDNGVFSLKPTHWFRDLTIGILHNDGKVITDTEEGKKEKKDKCMNDATAGVRFTCAIY